MGRFVLLAMTLVSALGRAQVTVSVHASADVHPISPLIYGINFASTAQATQGGLTLTRWGGNTTTRYNWQEDLSNTGTVTVTLPARSIGMLVVPSAAGGSDAGAGDAGTGDAGSNPDGGTGPGGGAATRGGTDGEITPSCSAASAGPSSLLLLFLVVAVLARRPQAPGK